MKQLLAIVYDWDERALVDRWDTLSADDRSAYWTTISNAARRVIYMVFDGRVGLL